ncbi:hypothetical protein BDR05DRAFT_1005730 [Suillus weaverae]|nr:hypothetical protein BDR05DRAFT_1005730 [Suillus weaverae]
MSECREASAGRSRRLPRSVARTTAPRFWVYTKESPRNTTTSFFERYDSDVDIKSSQVLSGPIPFSAPSAQPSLWPWSPISARTPNDTTRGLLAQLVHIGLGDFTVYGSSHLPFIALSNSTAGRNVPTPQTGALSYPALLSLGFIHDLRQG